MNELQRTLSSVTNQLYANALLRCILLATSAYVVTAAFAGSPVWPVLAGLLGFLAGVYLTNLRENKKTQAIRLIHQTIGDAEYSLPLLDKTQLNLAEQLQLERLNERTKNSAVPGVLFAHTSYYALGLLAAIAIYAGYPLLQKKGVLLPEKQFFANRPDAVNKPVVPPTFVSAELRTQPPTYTKLPETNSSDLNKSAITGSILTWRLRFSDARQLSVRLVSSRGQELTFQQANGVFTHQDKLLNSGLYALKAYWHTGKQDSLVYQSDFYRLEAQPDKAPKIEPGGDTPESKQLYRFHTLKDPKTLPITARISDDFSVSQAFIVATVARGSGENVKFRELKIPLSQANFTEARLTKVIDLNALNFSPGDELYYYWAAFDNRQPTPNFTKSDTYFLVYKDTTNQESSELATMAVNIMPEYFRSQRQIIIDTEKLLAKKKRVSAAVFKSTSNEIGYDQKILRLRYGQFMGEEFESSIGGGHAESSDDVSSLLAGYMHDHDKGEGEHDTGPKVEEPHHDHEEHAKDSENQDPVAALMEQYVHQHDNAETNTFHEQSTKALLKMALEQMWQSELHLRLYEPEKALPFEQKALEYLKMSQQKARSFVKKTGFDPPPIKEKETRLTGELINVNAAFNQQRTFDQARIGPLVSEVLEYVDLPKLTSHQRLVTQQLGTALVDRVLNSGLANWSVLSGLQKLAGGKPLSESEKTLLKTKLYTLTDPSEQTQASFTSDKTLERAFWQHLK